MTKDPDWLLNSTPRPVQMEALRRSYGGFGTRDSVHEEPQYFRLHSGAARGWNHYLEMRLGKSSLLLAEFELFCRDHGVRALLIVCPNSFKKGWVKEIEESGSLAVPVIWNGAQPSAATEAVRKCGGPFVVVANYEAVRTEKFATFARFAFGGKRWGLGIDESVKIKDPSSLQTKSVLDLAKSAFFVRNLSGKPSVQGPQDFYPQLRAIGQQNGVNFFAFRNRYCKMGGFKNKVVKGLREDNKAEFGAILRRCSFVAHKRDWGDPGQSSYSLEPVEVTPTQAKHYATMDDEFYALLEGGVEVSVDVVVSKLMKLVQISSGFLYHENKQHFFEDPAKLPKMLRLLDVMEETPGKVVVCYHYSASGDALLSALQKYNPAAIRSAEWMKKNGLDVESEKKKFNEDPDCRVIVCQISAAKYGHTLIGAEGHRAETMVFYESTYSLDDRSQVEMRNTYYNQDWVNLYLDFVGTDVETKMAEALQRKEDLVSAVVAAYKGSE